jgi:hypothetical protein
MGSTFVERRGARCGEGKGTGTTTQLDGGRGQTLVRNGSNPTTVGLVRRYSLAQQGNAVQGNRTTQI